VTNNCLNPACRVPFSHDLDGRIFSVDPDLEGCRVHPSHQPEQYWLCGTCIHTQKVVVEHGRITTVPMEPELALPQR